MSEVQTIVNVPAKKPVREPTQIQAPTEDGTIMNLIATMATDPAADISKLEKLISLKNDMENRQARISFARDYASMKAELPKVIKNKVNGHTKSSYADLANINEIVDPVLGKYGFASSTKIIEQTPTTITACAEITHKDGHKEGMNLTMPIDTSGGAAKTGVQGIASTITYLKRVAKCALLDIAAGDDDDGNSEVVVEIINIEQAADLDLRSRNLGESYHKRFLSWLGVDTAVNIKQSDYKKALAGLVTAEQDAKKNAAAKK